MNKVDIKNIELIIYDFDGVLTNNKVLVFQDGAEAVFCNRSDGLAISKIKQLGIPQIIVSTESNKVVKIRARKLDIPVIQNVKNKKQIVEDYCKKHNINLKKVIYIGNDVNDLEVMKIVGYPMTPIDGSQEVKEMAVWVIDKKGGEGVIREMLNIINVK